MQSQSDTDFLKTFSDETLEEAFPPTAEEAAELEAVEVFVVSGLLAHTFLVCHDASDQPRVLKNLMANLDMLERKEEATRLVRAGLQKRLEAKIRLVRSQEHLSGPQKRERTIREQGLPKVTNPRIGQRYVKLSAKQPIQQPRKHS